VKKLRKFSKNVIKELVNHLHHYEISQEEERLHQIRVEVKKLKALIGLIHYSQRKFKGHLAFLPFRNIFRKAGAVREPDVLRKLSEKTDMKRLKVKGSSPTDPSETFIDDIPFFIETIRKEWKTLKPHSRKISKNDFKRFFDSNMAEIESNLWPELSMKDIHKIRKTIKIVLYLSKIKNYLSGSEKAFFSRMEQMIGQLHDQQILLQALKKDHVDPLEIKKVTDRCEKDEEKIKMLVAKYYQ
jgi:CHAD domain-containing protein